MKLQRMFETSLLELSTARCIAMIAPSPAQWQYTVGDVLCPSVTLTQILSPIQNTSLMHSG